MPFTRIYEHLAFEQCRKFFNGLALSTSAHVIPLITLGFHIPACAFRVEGFTVPSLLGPVSHSPSVPSGLRVYPIVTVRAHKSISSVYAPNRIPVYVCVWCHARRSITITTEQGCSYGIQKGEDPFGWTLYCRLEVSGGMQLLFG